MQSNNIYRNTPGNNNFNSFIYKKVLTQLRKAINKLQLNIELFPDITVVPIQTLFCLSRGRYFLSSFRSCLHLYVYGHWCNKLQNPQHGRFAYIHVHVYLRKICIYRYKRTQRVIKVR